jgi:HEPN domain-containing protein
MPLKFWSLYDIMKAFKARDLQFLLDEMQEHRQSCDEGKKDPFSKIKPDDFLKMKQWMTDAEALFKSIGLKTAETKVSLTASYLWNIDPAHADFSALSADFRNIHDMLTSDLWHKRFIQIDDAYSVYVNNDVLFGKAVNRAFRRAIPDIREVGNCIAVDCGTAAVFHLMRAVEWSLRALCRHLGFRQIPHTRKPGKRKKYIPIEYNMWERMLDEAHVRVDAKIDKMRPGKKKQDAQQFYYPLLREYKGFKDAWRNHCMHAREEYSTKDAEAIMEHVKKFMTALARKVSE